MSIRQRVGGVARISSWEIDEEPSPNQAAVIHNDDEPPMASFHQQQTRHNRLASKFVAGGSFPRAPTMIPDKDYKDYLAGRLRRKRARGITIPITGPCCASFCASFSIIAMCFLLFVGYLIDTQPLYIKGVKPKDFSANDYADQQRYPCASHAYQTFWAYFFTLLLSVSWQFNPNIFHSLWTSLTTRIRRRGYHDIPDTDSTIPVFHTATAAQQQLIPAGSKSVFWNHVVIKFQHWRGKKPRRKRRAKFAKDI